MRSVVTNAAVFLAAAMFTEIAGGQGFIDYAGHGSNPATGAILSALVRFEILDDGTSLRITLSNLGDPVRDSSDILTTLFFSLSTAGSLTPLSAELGGGSILINGPPDAGTSMGDYWEYLTGLTGVPNGATSGIGSAGLGIFGQANFGTHPRNVDGYSYGIINGSSSGGNGSIPSARLVSNSLVFTLGGLPQGFQLSDISNVGFQYGTALFPTDPLLPGSAIPEPSAFSIAIFASALALIRRRSWRS